MLSGVFQPAGSLLLTTEPRRPKIEFRPTLSRCTHTPSSASSTSAAPATASLACLPLPIIDKIGAFLGKDAPVLLHINEALRRTVRHHADELPVTTSHAKNQSALLSSIAYLRPEMFFAQDASMFRDLGPTLHTLNFSRRKAVMAKAFAVDQHQATLAGRKPTDALYQLASTAAHERLQQCELQFLIRGLLVDLSNASAARPITLIFQLVSLCRIDGERELASQMLLKNFQATPKVKSTSNAVPPEHILPLLGISDEETHRRLAHALPLSEALDALQHFHSSAQSIIVEYVLINFQRSISRFSHQRHFAYRMYLVQLFEKWRYLATDSRDAIAAALDRQWTQDLRDCFSDDLEDIAQVVAKATRGIAISLPESLVQRIVALRN